PVMAANDGASGVGVMLEVAAKLKQVNPKVGIDFICFDLEDYGNHDSSDESSWCKGSAYWATHPHVEGYQALHGILLDMVGGNGVVFRQEIYSAQYAPQVLYQVWDAARVAGYENYFPSESGSMIMDDHIPMNQAGIPTIDIISSNRSGNGFCDTWHTTRDTPENISIATLKAVGQTLLQVISQEPL
ncbi:MAG: M28 family peptidase, partial [Bacteroidaceae bacterium]|nr:M28 family peptidase [Bacteroidaceae bacterium]